MLVVLWSTHHYSRLGPAAYIPQLLMQYIENMVMKWAEQPGKWWTAVSGPHVFQAPL